MPMNSAIVIFENTGTIELPAAKFWSIKYSASLMLPA